MSIIIEISGGCVSSAYSEGPIPAVLRVVVVDTDGMQVGEPANAVDMPIEGIAAAPDFVREALGK